MNKLFLNLFVLGILSSCAQSKPSSSSIEGINNIEIHFADGLLKGNHLFTKVKGKYSGGVGVHYNDETEKSVHMRNTFTLSANDLVSDTQLKLTYFAITAKGEVTEGMHDAVPFKNSNGVEYCVNLNLEGTHEQLGTFELFTEKSNCKGLKIEQLGVWEAKTIHKVQKVKGQFDAEVTLVFRDKQGNNIEKVQLPLGATFLADHRTLKDENKSYN